MIFRSLVAVAALGVGVVALMSDARAQNYPPYGAQQYPPNRGPAPSMAPADDDDDDVPPQYRAAPGNYPPPPGYRGPAAPNAYPNAYEPRPQAGVPIDRQDLPPPGVGDPYGGRGPSVIYGDRAQPQPDPRYGGYGDRPPPADPRYGYGDRQPPVDPRYAPQQPDPRYGGYGDRQPYGPPPAYGTAPPPYDPRGPVQITPNQDPAYEPGPSLPRPSRDVTGTTRPNTVATLPPEDQPESGKAELSPELRRQLVPYQGNEPAGTLVIDTQRTFLYFVMGNGQAMRYGIGVGREGFTWAGAERISRMAEWPDWHPPAEMIERQPYLPRFMAGGEGNPLGARALYLGKTLYRIHGTNQPSTIGKYVSSGCIRLTNDDIADLYTRVQVGTRVVVLPGGAPPTTAQNAPLPPMQQR
jgi:lipoprotein-anchoring transpeptidase ErfK/SrfK